MPTELSGPIGDALRGTGENPWDEYGTTTGRPRRCGWLDLVLLRYAVRINGLTELVMTKLDVLTGLDPLRVCIAYETGGERWENMPFGPNALEESEPVYSDLAGWTGDIMGARRPEDLPGAARAYVASVERAAGVPISLVSVGPEREQMVRMQT